MTLYDCSNHVALEEDLERFVEGLEKENIARLTEAEFPQRNLSQKERKKANKVVEPPRLGSRTEESLENEGLEIPWDIESAEDVLMHVREVNHRCFRVSPLVLPSLLFLFFLGRSRGRWR